MLGAPVFAPCGAALAQKNPPRKTGGEKARAVIPPGLPKNPILGFQGPKPLTSIKIDDISRNHRFRRLIKE